jgi:S1-C subfamily serine protease
VGSGTIIHPSGVILTAWHVVAVDAENPLSALWEQVVVELLVDVEQRPQPRYRAQVIAVHPQADLALLRIVQDERTQVPVALGTLDDLPWLPILDEPPSGAELRVVGYPGSLGAYVQYPLVNQSGRIRDA